VIKSSLCERKAIYLILVTALSAGLMAVLAFSPVNAYILAPLSLIILFSLWEQCSPKQACLLGFFWGLGLFSAGIGWIVLSLTQFGGMAWPIAIITMASLISLLALFPALVGYIANTLIPPSSSSRIKRHLVLVPGLWVLSEWIRSHLFSGFPWLLFGYTATSQPWLKAYAPVIGVFGLSLILAFIAGLFVYTFQQPRQGGKWWLALSLLAGLLLGNVYFQTQHWTHAKSKSLSVSLLQGNIKQPEKWNKHTINKILNTYSSLLNQTLKSHRLIIMPESAIPLWAHKATHYLRTIDSISRQRASALISGIPMIEASATGYHYYNSLLALGQARGHYYKHHLVPFGEYIPFSNYLNWVNQLITIPLSNLDSGPAYQPPIYAFGLPIAPFICYEIAYADQVIQSQKNTELLLVATDDSWFGGSWAAAQHLQIAQIRALESGRFLLFSSSTGITAVIDPNGNITKQLPMFTQASLNADIYPMVGNTPLTLWGSKLTLLLDLMVLGVILI